MLIFDHLHLQIALFHYHLLIKKSVISPELKEYIEENNITTPMFRGFEQLELEFKPTSFECNGCSNMCEVIRVISSDNEVLAVWGDKCGKYAGTSKASRQSVR